MPPKPEGTVTLEMEIGRNEQEQKSSGEAHLQEEQSVENHDR